MEGFFFYGIAWISWIVTTFFMRKTQVRLVVSVVLLLLIISSTSYQDVVGVRVYSSGIVLFVIGVSFIAAAPKSKLLCSLYAVMVGMMYSIFHFIEIYDPVWIQVHRTILLGGILAIGSLFYSDHPLVSIGTLLMGTVQGEIILAVTLKKYGFHNQVGGFPHLDVCFTAMVFLACMHVIFLFFRTSKKTTHTYVKGMK